MHTVSGQTRQTQNYRSIAMSHFRQEFIRFAIEREVLCFGEFKTKAGRLSPYFFNADLFNDGESLKQLTQFYAQAILFSKIPFDMLYGPAYKGIPLVAGTAIALAEMERNVPYCFNRKETKDHGEGGIIVGAPLRGKTLIIDDVVTAGTAIRESLQIIQNANATVAGIIVALDRQEKGQGELSAIQEIESTLQISVTSIITFSHIMEYIENEPQFSAYRQPMAAYRQQYGIG